MSSAHIELASISTVHLDAVGGVAGDMFVAALLAALPDLRSHCQAAVNAISPPPATSVGPVDHHDGVLTGLRYVVDLPAQDQAEHGPDHGHGDHTHWRNIHEMIANSELGSDIAGTAIAIFAHLAEAEAAVHGIAVDAVTFHEVGAWDSIIDIVSAAAILTKLDHCKWTIGALPRGRGLIRTAHGMLPLPAPATLKLLQGYALFDDGEDGERITPTGAAIIRYLGAEQAPDQTPRRLLASGTGFGTRRLKQRSNVLRATLYGQPLATVRSDTIEVLRCEIDDQTPEDLAIALAHIRQCDDVVDVCQWPVFAKKGRMATAVQVLVRAGAQGRISRQLLEETTTLGVRHSSVARTVVERHNLESADGIRVKVAERPGGQTLKAESDDIRQLTSARARTAARRAAEDRLRTDEASDD